MQILVLKDKIEYFLNNPGLQLSHPNKQDIVLDDIFVFPDLKQNNQAAINSKELLKINQGKNKISISGIEDSGKTTLIKVLIKHYLHCGYYPVYIDTQYLAITDPSELLEIIETSYADMYDPESVEKIHSETQKKKAIFIDNFDKISSDVDVLSDTLQTLCNVFDNIIFSEETPFKIIIDSRLKVLYPELSREISHYEIMEFNNELQLELIYKWNKLANTNESDIESVSLKTEKAKKIFDTVIGNNLAPSLPVFLLTILQSNIEDETKLVSGSSYGHYYEHLIIKSIVNSIEDQDIEPYLEFLSELSYYMFKEHKQSASHEELNYVYEEQLHHRANIESLELIKEALIRADTLIEEPLCRFKYKYIYHYFVARYLSANIELESIKEQIKHIFSELHNEDYANIVLFLTHLTDNPLIINELLLRTKSIFSDEALLSTQEDSLEIDELIEELSRLGTKDRKLKEAGTEYAVSNIDITRSRLRSEREGLKAANNILKIAMEVLRNRRSKYI